jgi:hypothetical protein
MISTTSSSVTFFCCFGIVEPSLGNRHPLAEFVALRSPTACYLLGYLGATCKARPLLHWSHGMIGQEGLATDLATQLPETGWQPALLSPALSRPT